jgi:Tfp pilus assembly protein PilF
MQALQRGNASVAATHFSRAVSRDGRHVMARIHLGQAYYLMRMHTQAIKQLDEALVVDPSNLLAHYNRAIVLHRGLREFKRARDSLEIVLSAPETGSSLRKKALGAVRNLDRDAQGRDNLATIGSF